MINGPRFSTRAESVDLQRTGASIIGMTAMPEAALARELALCFTSLCLVTDHDAGVEAGAGVTHAQVLEMFAAEPAEDARAAGGDAGRTARRAGSARLRLRRRAGRHHRALPAAVTGPVLLTGGAGFIGRHVLAELLAGARQVRVLDSLRPDVHGSRWTPPDGVRLQVGDVRDPAAVDQALAGIDTVLHLAAKVGLGVDIADLPDYAGSNVTGTAELLAGMARAGVGRLVLASSMVVYGEGLGRCAEHGSVTPGPAGRTGAGRRRIRAAMPGLRARWTPRW